MIDTKKLTALRREKKMTLQELADELGVKQSAVCLWESGQRTPPLQKIEKIAKFFNVSVDYLLVDE